MIIEDRIAVVIDLLETKQKELKAHHLGYIAFTNELKGEMKSLARELQWLQSVDTTVSTSQAYCKICGHERSLHLDGTGPCSGCQSDPNRPNDIDWCIAYVPKSKL